MCSSLMVTRSVGCVVLVTIDEVGLGSILFLSAGAVLKVFVCVDLAWDEVMCFVCFLCGIRFAEH